MIQVNFKNLSLWPVTLGKSISDLNSESGSAKLVILLSGSVVFYVDDPANWNLMPSILYCA